MAIEWVGPTRNEKPDDERRSAVITVRMTIGMHNKIKEQAHVHHVSLNTLVTTAIDTMLKQMDEVDAQT